MQALVKSAERLAVEDRQTPSLKAQEVLVRVHVAGVCRTDIAVARGALTVRAPTILGHEASGVVCAVGAEVARSRLGERVALWPFVACGRCARCVGGATGRCPYASMLGVQRDGAFAEFVAIHSQNAVADHALSPRQLAYAEPVCAALAVCEPLRELSAGASLELAIVGCNRIATLTALVVQWCTGITPAVLSSSAVAQTETDRYDLIIESAAAEDVLAHAVRVLRPGGTLILKSRPSGPVALNYRAIVQKELQMRGAHYGDFLNALQWIASHQAAVEPLLGPVFALTDFEQAFAHDGHGEANKCFLAADTRLAESW